MRGLLSISVSMLLASFMCAGRSIPDDIAFNPVDSKKLPSNHVKCLYQDEEGFIWIATNNGLARYDGSDVVSYTDCLQGFSFLYEVIEDSFGRLVLATDRGVVILDKVTGRAEAVMEGLAVSSLAKDHDGNIWAGGEDGLFFCPAEGETFDRADIIVSEEPLKGVIDILPDNEGNVWMTTWQKGLYMYDPSAGTTEIFRNGDLAYSYVLHQDSDNVIWVGTWGCGLLSLNDDFRTSEGYVRYATMTPEGNTLLDEVVYAINDIDGYVLVGGQKGFSIIDKKSEDMAFYDPGSSDRTLPYNQVNSILVTANGNVFLGLFGGGMCSVDDRHVPYSVDPLSDIRRRFGTSTVHGVFTSADSWLWLGISDNGFILYDPESHKVVKHNEIPAFDGLLSISTADAIVRRNVSGEICIGTFSEGLWVYDVAKGRVRTFTAETCPSMLSNNIFALENDSAGNLWIGTGIGAYVLTSDDELKSLEEFALNQADRHDVADQIRGISASPDGKVYFATTSSGIVEVDVPGRTYEVHANPGAPVSFMDVLVDMNGDVWAGSLNDGLYFYDCQKKTLSERMPVEGLESVCITNMLRLPEGEIWVTTTSELLTFISDTETDSLKVTRYITDLDVDFTSNSSMLCDDLVIFGTTEGLFRYDLHDTIIDPVHKHTLVLTDLIINGTPYRDMDLLDEDINSVGRVRVKRGDHIEIRYTLLDYNHFFSPVYSVSYDGRSVQTVKNSVSFHVTSRRTKVHIAHLPYGQSKHLILNASGILSYLIVLAVLLLVVVCYYVYMRKDKSQHDVIAFEIDKINFTSADQELLKRAMEVIQAHISDADFKQDDFIREMGVSRTLLTEKLKELTGFTPISLIMEIRLKTAYNSIMSAREKLRISDVAYSVGFNDAKYFGTCFRKKYGLTPKELMNQRLEAIRDNQQQ